MIIAFLIQQLHHFKTKKEQMKFLSTLFFTFLCFTAVNAQKGATKNDPSAKKLLDAVSAKFKTYKSVQANFVLKIENAAGKNLGTKTGKVYMKAAKYRISFPGQEVYSDGSNVWTHDVPSKEVTITKIDAGSNSLTPQKLFTNFYDKDFYYKMNDAEKVGGVSMQVIELTPTDKTKPFHKVLLYVANNTIVSTKIYEKTGNRYTYSTSSLKPNTAIADATFVYDAKKNPGVEVVDLR